MSQLRKFAKHSSHYLIGRVGLLLLGFVSFPLFTRILSVEQYGLLTLITSALFVARAFGNVGLTQAVQRFHGENAENLAEFRRYYSTLFFGSCGLAVVAVAACVLLALLMPPAALGPGTRSILLVASALLFARILQPMITNLWQVEGKTWVFQGFDFAMKALTIAVALFLLWDWEKTARANVVALAVVELLLLAITVMIISRRHILALAAFDRQFFRDALGFGVPLMWAELGFLVHDSGDRVLVRYFLGATALGLYSAAYGVAAYVRDVLEVPITLALFPICMETWNKHGEAKTRVFLSQSLRLYCMVSIGLLAALTVLSRDLLVILASRKYEQAHSLLPVLMAGLVVASFQVFARIGLLIHRRPSMIARSMFWAIITNTFLNIVLLPWLGLIGAAIATLLSFSLQVFLTARESLKIFPLPIDVMAIAKYLAAGTLVAAIGWQIHLRNVWAELFIRGAVATSYVVLIWFLDSTSRQAVLRLISAAAPYEAVEAIEPH